MKSLYGCTCSVCLICYQYINSCSILAEDSNAIIRVNVLAGKRPLISANDNVEGYKEIMMHCWSSQPDCRLDFKGK